MEDSRTIARRGLEIQAIKLNSDNPFEWASGFRMPIYNDNRMFLFHPDNRELIVDAFVSECGKQGFSVLAGTSTSGIPWATALAERFKAPLVYVRDKPKDHGLRNQIEGIDSEKDLDGHAILLIEDLISTGGSSAAAVQAVRNANGTCNYCLSIFNYGFNRAMRIFRGEEPYDKEGHRLDSPCEVRSLLTYDTLIEVARETGYINDEQEKMLAEWRADPFGWGEKHGFPKVERK